MSDHLSQSMLNGLPTASSRRTNSLRQTSISPGAHPAPQMLFTKACSSPRRQRPGSGIRRRTVAGALDAAGIVPMRLQRQVAAIGTSSSGDLDRVGAAAVLLLISVTVLVQRSMRQAETGLIRVCGIVTEVFDQHVATLAGNLPPQVISTDRHTVKPWFQGKIPFSSIYRDLPRDYARWSEPDLPAQSARCPTALQHWQASRFCFCTAEIRAASTNESADENAGFHVMGFSTSDLKASQSATWIRLAWTNWSERSRHAQGSASGL